MKLRSIREPETNTSQDSLVDSIREIPPIEFAKQTLAGASQVLVTGRIASVQTARAAVALALSYNATIDCTLDDNAFANIEAMQRSGMNSVSIAEVRDHADLVIVVGDDSMLELYPRMPQSLCNPSTANQTVLLLGRFSKKSVDCWKRTGADVWSFPLDIQDIPTSLSQWYRYSQSLSQSADRPATNDDSRTTQQLTDALFRKMANATYTSVVWCSETLTIDHPDLWVERLWQSIAERNETSRCAGLAWASLNATFQQVCTWLTGFPGRIRFRNGLPEYDPNDYSTRVWLNNRDSMATTSASKPLVILYIDETVGQGNDFLHSLRKTSPGCSVIEISVNAKQFPTLVPGIETSADIFRADQCLLAHIEPGLDNESSSGHADLRSAAQWLEGLHP